MVGPVPQSWAVDPELTRAFEVVPGVWQLRLPLPWKQVPHVNAFTLPLEGGGIALVDCGSAGHESLWDALVRALELTGRTVGDVRQVVLTHYHSDHAGVLERLKEQSGAEILGHPGIEAFTDGTIGPDAIRAAREDRARREGAPSSLLPACSDIGEEVNGVMAPTPPDRPLFHGDVLPTAVGPWNVIETPGHAPSHLTFHQPALGIAIVGDVIAPSFYPYFDYGYSPDPVAEYFLAFERLVALDPVHLVLLGHGRPLEDLAGTVATWRSELRQRVDRTATAVGDGATNAWEATSRLFDVEASGEYASLQLAEVITYLRHLRRCGRVVRSVAPDGSFRYRPC